MFGSMNTTVNETCSCGATFRASGPLATMAAYDWRAGHQWCARGAEKPRKRPRNSAGVKPAPDDHQPPVRNSDGDSEWDQ